MNKYFNHLFLIVLSTGIAWSQFGQNIVQYDDFEWYYIQSKHFDIYYYGVGDDHADYVAHESEVAHNNISEKLNWTLKNRVPIIVYNSHNDFQQTNVVDSYMYEGIGGVTELFKNRVVIPFDGSHKEFKHVIHHELVHAFIIDYIYGGNIQNLIANQVKAQIPGWMNEGLAEYLASGWDTNSDMWMRDLAINGDQLPMIQQLTGYMAYRGGQSVWKFITSKWGEESIAEIFYQIKSEDNVKKGLELSLGIEMEELSEQWQSYLKKEYWPDVSGRQNLEEFSRQLTNHEELENSYNIAPALSPDGSQIAVFSNKSGTMGIYLISAEDGRFLRQIIKGERSAEYEELHILKPGITWSPDGKNIAFAAKSGKSDVLVVVDIITEEVERFRFDMEGIFRASWNPVDNEIAFIGNNGKTTDIYVFNLDMEELVNLTNDWFSEDQVSWAPDGESLLFISDRGDDLIVNTPFNKNTHNVDKLDIYQILRIGNKIIRLTNTDFAESYPLFTSNMDKIIYISDEFGINNINVLDLQTLEVKPITNVLTGISQLSWNQTNSHLLFSGFEKSGYDIFMMANPLDNTKKTIAIEKTNWTQNQDTRPLLNKPDKKKAPGTSRVSYKNYVFSDNYFIQNKDSSEIKVEFPLAQVQDSSGRFIKHQYKTRFTLDLIQGYAYNSAFYSPNAMIYFLFSDILGDHKIYLGTEMQISLEDSDYFLLYRLLPYKTDYNFQIYHLAEHYQNYGEIVRLRNLGLSIGASRPFSRFQRMEFGIQYNYIEHAVFEQEETSTFSTSYNDKTIKEILNTAIPSIGYVWDNTLWSYMYPIDGIRAFANLELSPKLNDNGLDFSTICFDIRGYNPLKNGVSLAGRMYFGKSFGENAQNFHLGGVPWLFSSEDNIYANDPRDFSGTMLQNIFLSEYIMPVRGAQINEIEGTSTILFNAELRLPFLVYYFPSIKYFGQINGVIFTDIGVAWSGKKPDFWEGESWNSSPRDFVWTYGFGPRFILFGLPVKLDYAWEYIPNHKSERMWYVSIGLDF